MTTTRQMPSGMQCAGLRNGKVNAWPMTEPDALAFSFDKRHEVPVAYMELVSGYIKPPKPKAPGEESSRDDFRLEGMSHRMFAFGKSVGIPIGAMRALGIPVNEVPPAKWQKALGISRSGATRQAWKNKLKDRAQQLYPEIKVTLAIADALLLLNYATKLNQGKLL